MFDNIISDIKGYSNKYKNIPFLKRCFYLIFAQELYPVLVYRFGHWANYEFKLPVFCQLMRFFYFFLRKGSEIISNVGIWPESKIGKELRIEHWGGISIKAKIGNHCRIQQQVVIGHIGGNKGGGVPSIGDNVYIGVGAKILGDVSIGNNVIIGANAVVITDIPDNVVAVGIPAKVVKKSNSIKVYEYI